MFIFPVKGKTVPTAGTLFEINEQCRSSLKTKTKMAFFRVGGGEVSRPAPPHLSTELSVISLREEESHGGILLSKVHRPHELLMCT